MNMLDKIPRHLLERAAADPRNGKAAVNALQAAIASRGPTTHRTSAEASGRGSSAVEDTVTLVLPLPPSVNSYWRSVPASRNRIAHVLISEQGRKFKKACQIAAAAQCAKPLAGDVSLRCVVYFADRRRDLDNCAKPLLDALQGILYANDRQITHLELTKRYDAKRPRVELMAQVVGSGG